MLAPLVTPSRSYSEALRGWQRLRALLAALRVKRYWRQWGWLRAAAAAERDGWWRAVVLVVRWWPKRHMWVIGSKGLG